MAYSAAASRAPMPTDQPRSRPSSPLDDHDFATATSFHGALHSTPQRENNAFDYSNFPDSPGAGGDDSADMSIEMGRGLKGSAGQVNQDMSSAIFSFGNDNSQYEITATPPIRTRTTQRKTDGTLRKEASLRRATETARAKDSFKPSASTTKQRAVSDNSANFNLNPQPHEPTPPNATFTFRGSRFSRHVSTTYTGLPARFTVTDGLEMAGQTPRRHPVGNATVESATYTANQSFMLPDLPNITELVSGVRKDGTPVLKRPSAPRTRFVSAAHRSHPLPDVPAASIPVPEDEKAIIASLQLLQNKIFQLEGANAEYRRRVEEYVDQIDQLKAHVNALSIGAEGTLRSEDDDSVGLGGSQAKEARLQAKVKAMQDRLDKAERKTSTSGITVSRVVKERDALITQIATTYHENEELVQENEAFRGDQARLQEENADLRLEVESLRAENEKWRTEGNLGIPDRANVTGKTNRARAGNRDEQDRRSKHSRDVSQGERRNKKDTTSNTTLNTTFQRRPSTHQEDNDALLADLASRIEQEVQKHRDAAAGRGQEARNSGDGINGSTTRRRKSESQSRMAPEPQERVLLRRHVSAPVEDNTQGARSTTQHTFRGTANCPTDFETQENVTDLSTLDLEAVSALRRKLELDLRAKKQRTTTRLEEDDKTTDSNTRPAMPRKSSLKDLTGRISFQGETLDDIVTTSKATKTVRLQSPHSSMDHVPADSQEAEGDVSLLSNISRRRKRTTSQEGMTSAFILPDITIHGMHSVPTNMGETCIQHAVEYCTACASDGKVVDIPLAIPVTEREGYGEMTDATIRPAEEPAIALATVIKNLKDEITHLKLQREKQNRLYNQHDPAVSKRTRQKIKGEIDRLTSEIEKRSDQVYRLYDVLEGLKQPLNQMTEQEIEETMTSVGLDPAEFSGRVGRKAPVGLDDADKMSEFGSEELPWEGLSDDESDEEVRGLGQG